MQRFNLKFITFLLSVLFLSLAVAQAQTKEGNIKQQYRKKAAGFINKTNMIMAATGERVKAKKVYTGYLKKAKSLEKKAVGHFNAKEHQKAIKKSYIARRYSFMAYTANAGKVPNTWRLTEAEKNEIKKLFEKKITNEELQNKVTKEDKEADETEDGIVEDVEGGGDS